MKTRRIYSIIGLLLCTVTLISSCTKESAITPDSERGTGCLELSIYSASSPSEETKAQVAAESTINSVTVFVFDTSSGILERKFSSTPGTSSATISDEIKTGAKTIYAYANFDINTGVGSSLSEHPLTTEVSLSNNSFDMSSFTMYGTTTATINKNATTTKALSLTRIADRVVLTSIKNSLSVPLTIIGAYLSNVYTNYSGASNASSDKNEEHWLNKWGRDKNYELVTNAANNLQMPAMTSWFDSTDGLPYTISSGSTKSWTLSSTRKGPRFYCMLNNKITSPSDDNVNNNPYVQGAPWAPLQTNLVIVASINGTLCYYAVPCPLSAINQSQNFSLTIHAPGTADPQILCDIDTYDLDFTTEPWQDGGTMKDDSTPEYRGGIINRNPDHTSVVHVAQRLYLQMSVLNQKSSVRPNITFSATLTEDDGTVSNVTSWISSTYDSSNTNWELNIACRKPGRILVKALYDGDEIASYTETIRAPRCYSSAHLLLTGDEISLTQVWKKDIATDETLSRGNTTTLTDGSYFDSALYDSLLGNAANSIEFDTDYENESMLSTRTSGSSRYLKIANFGSGKMTSFIQNNLYKKWNPVLSRFRYVAPCGIKGEWNDITISNPYYWFYENTDDIKKFTYDDNTCYNSNVNFISVSGGSDYSSSSFAFSWEWITARGYTFGCGNTEPIASISSSITFSNLSIKLNNTSRQTRTNAAGASYIYLILTNTPSGQTVKLPVLYVGVYKTFYFYAHVESATWDIYYAAPDVSAYANDIPVSPVAVPQWNSWALKFGVPMTAGAKGNVPEGYREAFFGTTTTAQEILSCPQSYTSSIYTAGPEEIYFHGFYYSFKPAYNRDTNTWYINPTKPE